MSTCSSDNINNRWSKITYPGEQRVFNGIDPTAGSWPMHYIKRNEDGSFSKLNGDRISFEIAHPSYFNYKKELEEVIQVQNNITPAQIKIAKYWGNGVPLKQITPIVTTLINTYKISPLRSARIMSAVYNAANDAFVITWYFKYLWDYPRPCQLDPSLQTVLNTPRFPAYPSGHSVVSATVSVVLSYFFPSESEKLKSLAEIASVSRLYGGVHFDSDLKEGLRLGRQIGSIIVESIKSETDNSSSIIDLPRTDYLNAPIIPNYNDVN